MGLGYGMMRGFAGYGGFGIISIIFQALVFVAIILLVIYAIRALSRHYPAPRHDHYDSDSSTRARRESDLEGRTPDKRESPSESEAMYSALRILAERFAKGEISAEEYDAMKEHLKK